MTLGRELVRHADPVQEEGKERGGRVTVWGEGTGEEE